MTTTGTLPQEVHVSLFCFELQAYLVYKYSGKEQPQTTISRGSKYIAAPKSASTMMSNVVSRETSSMGDKLCEDGDCGNTLEKDIQV